MKIKISILCKSFDPIKNDFLYLNSNLPFNQLEAPQIRGLVFEKLQSSASLKKAMSLKKLTENSEEACGVLPSSNLANGNKNDGSFFTSQQSLLSYKSDSIGMPVKRSLYTVLRSPHIDKKSREQFEMKVYKQLLVIRTDIKQLRNYLTYLKYRENEGIQMKIVIHYTTRFSF